MLAAAREAAAHERKKDAEFVAAAVDRLKAKGAVLMMPDKRKFVALIAPIQDEVAKELKMTDLLQTGPQPREVRRACVDHLLARLEQWLLPLLGALLAFITLGVFIQVVLRYVFATSFLWGEELSLFAFIWCVFLGAAICVAGGAPISRSTIFAGDPERPRRRRAAAGGRPLRPGVTRGDGGRRLAVLAAQRRSGCRRRSASPCSCRPSSSR